MYSNDKGSRFSILNLLVKIIFFVLFVLVILWLFPKTPNMKPFYSNVFRENISYMQEAAEAYFTNDKMPKEIGASEKITLGDMIDGKLIIPFVDKDGNECDNDKSYVSVTKNDDGSYSLKTNLVCPTEEDFLIKILGCHNYCGENGTCEKVCQKEKITEYQFKKQVSKTTTSYSCPKGYNLDGKTCIKTYIASSKSAISLVVKDITLTMAAKKVYDPAREEELDVIKTKKQLDPEKVFDNVIINKEEDKTEKVCTTTEKQEEYKCNCTTYRDSDGRSITTCNTCTRTIPVETCTDVTTVGKTNYSCPSISTNHSGEGENLKCWHFVNRETIVYSCPSGTTKTTGKDSTLRCFKEIPGKIRLICTDNTYQLVGDVCKKEIKKETVVLSCEDNSYVREGDRCNLYKTEKKGATATKKTTKSYKYTWSSQTSLSGWTRTGKTRTKEGKEICK